MKKILFILLSLPYFLFAQQECIGDDETFPCCNEIIRTDPVTPSFARTNDRAFPFINPSGFMKNSFNWLTPSFSFPGFTNLTNNPFAQPSQSRYKMLNNNYPPTWTILQYLEQSPYHPKYGWELITANFNTDLFPDPNAEPRKLVSGPTIVLYNKYLSKLLIMASPGSGTNYDKTIFNVGFDYSFDDKKPKSQNKYTASLFNDYRKSQALDEPIHPKEIQIPAAPAGQYDWAFGEMPVSYDPCVCQFPGQMKIETYAYSTSAVKLEGRAVGTSVQFDNSGNPTLQNGRDWLNSVWTIDENNPNDPSKLNWVVQGGAQTYNNIDKLAEKYKQDPLWSMVTSLLNTASSLPGLGGIKIGIGNTLDDLITGLAPSFVQKLLDSQARSDIKSTKVSVGQILSGGASFFSMFKGGATPNASIVELEMQLQGRIYSKHRMTSVNDIEFATPGSYLSNTPNKAWTNYPMYNEAMGIIALLEKPKVSLGTYDNPFSNFGIFINKIFIGLKDPIKYSLNPAAEINKEKSKINASYEIVLKFVLKDFFPLSPNTPIKQRVINSLVKNLNYNFKDIMELIRIENTGTVFKFTFSTKPIPINNLHKIYYEIPEIFADNTTGSYVIPLEGFRILSSNIEKIDLKLSCDLVHNINNYNIENSSSHFFTYDLRFDENQYDFFGNLKPTTLNLFSPPNKFNNIQAQNPIPSGNMFVNKGNMTFTNNIDFYFSNVDIVNTNLFVSPGVKVRIYVTGTFILSPNSIIDPSIEIIPILPITDFGPIVPIDISNIKEFCNGNKYEANEPFLKSSKVPLPSKIDNSTTSLSLHPNPASSIAKLKLTNYQNTSANIKIFDLMGREMLEVLEKDITSREHSLDLDIERLAPGNYIVKVNNGLDEKTTKLVVFRY